MGFGRLLTPNNQRMQNAPLGNLLLTPQRVLAQGTTRQMAPSGAGQAGRQAAAPQLAVDPGIASPEMQPAAQRTIRTPFGNIVRPTTPTLSPEKQAALSALLPQYPNAKWTPFGIFRGKPAAATPTSTVQSPLAPSIQAPQLAVDPGISSSLMQPTAPQGVQNQTQLSNLLNTRNPFSNLQPGMAQLDPQILALLSQYFA